MRLLAAIGFFVLAVNLYEDLGIFHQGAAEAWSADAMRQMAGHVVREIFVVGAICGLLWPRPAFVPFMAAAGLHGLYVWGGYFEEVRFGGWAEPRTWFGAIDVAWRCALLVCTWRMRAEFFDDLRGRR